MFLARAQTPPALSPPRVAPCPSRRLSPELQYEINFGPAGNERSPQEIERRGRGGVGGADKKKNSRKNHRSDFWHPDVQLRVLPLSRTAPCIASLPRLFPSPPDTANICLRRALVRAAASVPAWWSPKGARLMKGSGPCCFFPGTALAPVKPRKWTSKRAISAGPCLCCSALKDNMTPSDLPPLSLLCTRTHARTHTPPRFSWLERGKVFGVF